MRLFLYTFALLTTVIAELRAVHVQMQVSNGATSITMDGSEAGNSVLLVENGEITAIASRDTISIPDDVEAPVALRSCYEDYAPKTRVTLFDAIMNLTCGLAVNQAPTRQHRLRWRTQ